MQAGVLRNAGVEPELPGSPEPCSLCLFPWETRRLGSRKAGGGSGPTLAFAARSPTPSARPAVARTGGHNSSEAAVTPGGSSCPCTAAEAAPREGQGPRRPSEQVQLCFTTRSRQ